MQKEPAFVTVIDFYFSNSWMHGLFMGGRMQFSRHPSTAPTNGWQDNRGVWEQPFAYLGYVSRETVFLFKVEGKPTHLWSCNLSAALCFSCACALMFFWSSWIFLASCHSSRLCLQHPLMLKNYDELADASEVWHSNSPTIVQPTQHPKNSILFMGRVKIMLLVAFAGWTCSTH